LPVAGERALSFMDLGEPGGVSRAVEIEPKA